MKTKYRFGRPPRRLRFTRAGKFYVGFTIAIGFAAINTGNNLLFLVVGLLLAGVVISGLLSEAVLRDVLVRRVLPTEARAGRPALVGFTVENRKRRFASVSLIVRDIIETGTAGEAFALHLPPSATRELTYRWTPERRGLVRFIRVELATRYPFGLFEKWREVDLEEELVVFPRVTPPPAMRTKSASSFGERPSGVAGPGSEFFALRDQREGDDARLVHWRKSARRQRPVVVERERERRRRLLVLLDNRAPSDESFERAIEEAAAVVHKALSEGSDVGLSTAGELHAPASGAIHERRLLRTLALLNTAGEGAAPRRLPDADWVEVAPASEASR